MPPNHINHELNKLIPIADELLKMTVPYCSVVSAGFPGEAYNYMEKGMDFNELIIRQQETTYCLVAGGDSLSGDGIAKGDLLVIDKLVEPYLKRWLNLKILFSLCIILINYMFLIMIAAHVCKFYCVRMMFISLCTPSAHGYILICLNRSFSSLILSINLLKGNDSP